MDFYSILEERGLLDVLRRVEYEPPSFVGWEKVKSFLLDIVRNGKSVYVEGDYDVDGLCCSLVIQDSFKYFGVENFYIYRYRKRTHSVDPVAVQQCIQGHYDYFLVADTGSSDLGLLQQLTSRGIKVIVLDHHNTEFTYEDFGDDIAVINTTIENELGGKLALSAGALSFIVMDLLGRELGRELPQSFSAYATTSLFADIMDMHNELNRALYYYSVEQPEDELPPQLTYFKNQYSKFNARYIGFWYSPRINACFRSENLGVLNDLFFNPRTAEDRKNYIEYIERVYTSSRSLVSKVADITNAFCYDMENFVFADLTNLEQYYDLEECKLYNYTGLIANKIAERHGKTGVVVCPYDGAIKGSVRDLRGRNYFEIFKQLCYAGGHNSAFGIKINILDFDRFMLDLDNVDRNYSISEIGNAPIIINVDNELIDEAMLEDMARYNEFASPNVPVVLLQKRMVGISEVYSSYYYKYKWDEFEIQSDTKVRLGETVLIKPLFSSRLKLLVQK